MTWWQCSAWQSSAWLHGVRGRTPGSQPCDLINGEHSLPVSDVKRLAGSCTASKVLHVHHMLPCSRPVASRPGFA